MATKPTNDRSILSIALLNELRVSIANNEYGDIRSILDEHLPKPLWSERMAMNLTLAIYVEGAIFTFDSDGWGYEEEGE